MKIYQLRWFVLTTRGIKYFHDPKETRAAGSMAIENVEVLREDGKSFSKNPNNFSQMFYIKHPSRTYAVSADNPSIAKEWMTAIAEQVKKVGGGVDEDDEYERGTRHNDIPTERLSGSEDEGPIPARKESPRGPIPAAAPVRAAPQPEPARPQQPLPPPRQSSAKPVQSSEPDLMNFDNSFDLGVAPAAAAAPAPAKAKEDILSLFDAPKAYAAPAANPGGFGGMPAFQPQGYPSQPLQQPGAFNPHGGFNQPPAFTPAYQTAAFNPYSQPQTQPQPSFTPLQPQASNPFAASSAASPAMHVLVPDNQANKSRPDSSKPQKAKNEIDIDPFAAFK